MSRPKNWQPISDRIIKRADLYTTKDFKPTTKDISDILSIDPNASIAFEGSEIMIFRDSKLECCGEKFHSKERK